MVVDKDMKLPIDSIVDFPRGDTEGDLAREQYKTNSRVLAYVKLMRNGARFPPIEITRSGHLLDGIHRLTAYKLLGRKFIEVVYS